MTLDSPLPGEPPRLLTYEVEPGDTVLGLAEKFGISANTIRWANGLGNDLLKIGQKLTILPVSGVLHKVKAGESVLSIAAAYGADATKVVEANLIPDPSLVREGDLLIVPGGTMRSTPAPSAAEVAEATKHTVKSGDTLSSIAAAYGVRISALREANGLGDSDLLRIGQLLSIPGGKQPQAAPPAAPPAEEKSAEAPEATSQEREASNRGDQKEGRSFIANVTAYTIQGRTSSGTQTRWGVVAVDPRVVPMGSRLRIDGFEETFVAEDTGGGIRGNWIDIWFPDHGDAIRFGMQARRVTIVEP